MACLMNYTVQCKDVESGKTGCFLFDTEYWQETGKFKAISPVFYDLHEFYEWDNANGSKRQSCHLERFQSQGD